MSSHGIFSGIIELFGYCKGSLGSVVNILAIFSNANILKNRV